MDLAHAAARVGELLPANMRAMFRQVMDDLRRFPELHPLEISVVHAQGLPVDKREECLRHLKEGKVWPPVEESSVPVKTIVREVPVAGNTGPRRQAVYGVREKVIARRPRTRGGRSQDARERINLMTAKGPTTLEGVHLAGDSQMVRLSYSVGIRGVQLGGRNFETGLAKSGQTVAGLTEAVRKSPAQPAPRKLAVLVGVNDVLRDGSNLNALKGHFKGLVRTITGKWPSTKVALVTLPPIPCRPDLNEKVEELNCNLRALAESSDALSVIDFHPQTVVQGEAKESLFQTHYSDGREDGVHLNTAGLQVLRQMIAGAPFEKTNPVVEDLIQME